MLRSFLSLVLALHIAAGAAQAQQPSPKSGTASPFPGLSFGKPLPPGSDVRSKLDALLDANDLQGVAAAYLKAPNLERMNWARDRLARGATVMLAIAYMRDLWTVGDAAKSSNPEEDLRITAGLMWLYAYQAMIIDGPKCEDASAPTARRQNFLVGFRPVYEFLKAQPEAYRVTMLGGAIKLETNTASKRPNDYYLCGGGMAEVAAATQQREMANKTVGDVAKAARSGSGNTVTLPLTSNYVPKFVAKAIYEPKQKEMRALLPEQLTGILK